MYFFATEKNQVRVLCDYKLCNVDFVQVGQLWRLKDAFNTWVIVKTKQMIKLTNLGVSFIWRDYSQQQQSKI